MRDTTSKPLVMPMAELPGELPGVLPRAARRVMLAAAFAVALWAASSATLARAEVSDQDLEVCMAYAQIELATQYGSPSSLVFINDGRATMERYDGMVDGHYVSTILRLDGVLTPPDGVPRPVRVTCLLASVGEPVGLRLEPRR